MGITDKLRSFAARADGYELWCPRHKSELISIADGIDAEHAAMQEYWRKDGWNTGYDEGFASADDWLAQHEGAMEEHGWAHLPKDAEGEPIHIGDVMEWMPYDETYQPVIRTVVGVGTDVFFAWSNEKSQYAQYCAEAYRHHHAPTVEDVLLEFAKTYGECADAANWQDIIAEYAAKLRLAGEGDE